MLDLTPLLRRLADAGAPLEAGIERALLRVDLTRFTDHDPEPFLADAPVVFHERPDGGVKTISAPHMIVMLLHHLELRAGMDVLIVGAKGGYLAAVAAELVGPSGSVMLVDPDRAVIDHARDRLADHEPAAPVTCRKLADLARAPPGLPEPLDRALVTGALEAIPTWLRRRLSDGGLILAPIGGVRVQRLLKSERQGETWLETDLGGVVFGPVDVKEAEPWRQGTAALAERFAEVLELADDHGLAAHDEVARLRRLVGDLHALLEEHADGPELRGALEDALEANSAWLSTLLPRLEELLGDLSETLDPDEDEGLGSHDDLVP